MTESPMPIPGAPEAQAGQHLPLPEAEPAPARTIKPLYLVGGALAALALLGGVGYAVLAANSQDSATVAGATRTPGASSNRASSPATQPSPGASTLDVAPVVLATRNPFTTKPTAAASGTGTTAGAASGSTTTVTTTATTTATATKRVTSTVTKTSTATVTDAATYVFVASVSGAQATLVVNGSVPVTLNANESTSGVTFVQVDPGHANCAMVELVGAAGGGTSVCQGHALQLG